MQLKRVQKRTTPGEQVGHHIPGRLDGNGLYATPCGIVIVDGAAADERRGAKAEAGTGTDGSRSQSSSASTVLVVGSCLAIAGYFAGGSSSRSSPVTGSNNTLRTTNVVK